MSCLLIEFLFIGNTWLENKSFSIEPPIVPRQQQQEQKPPPSVISVKAKPMIDVKPKEQKQPIQNIFKKKNEPNEFVFNLKKTQNFIFYF